MEMKKMDFAEKATCCGCSACADICQSSAIQMKEDEEGFFYPQLDKRLCTGCGLCGAVCPVKADSEGSDDNSGCTVSKTEPICFGAQAKDPAIRAASSSGGVFAALAGYVLSRQGVVYGAAFNENMEVVHQEVSSLEELEDIKKTKYVQSKMDGIYQKIAGKLREHKWVLFCGTPCQAQALRLFLNQSVFSREKGSEEESPSAKGAAFSEETGSSQRSDYDSSFDSDQQPEFGSRLIIADLVCYGVPSPGIWGSYVKYLEHKHRGKMTGFSFRDKRNKDNGHTCAYTIDTREHAGPLAADLYCRMYFANYILRPSCHKCQFCTTDRSSDLTLGDFWGIEKVRPEVDDKMGTSLVMLHTGQGRRIWDLIKEELSWFSCKREDLLQPRLIEPTPVAKRRRLFMKAYKTLPFSLMAGIQSNPVVKNLARLMYIPAKLKDMEWNLYKKRKAKGLKNEDFTIITSNCNGAFMYYDMGLNYRTPTVNLAIDMDDFVKMAENLPWYMEQEFVEVESERPYPAGRLGDITVHFVHYKTFEEGVQKWEERKRRINWDNLFLVATEKDNCSYETIRRFDQLPYEHKVIFTHTEYLEFASACYIKGFEEKEELGVLTFYKNQLLKRRYLDDFDYVTFLNKTEKTKSGGQ